MTDTTSIRRLRGRRLDATVAVAAVLVALVAAALVLVRPHGWTTMSAAATSQPLTSATRVCPGALEGTSLLYAASDVGGSVSADGGTSVRLSAGRPAPLAASTNVVTVSGSAAGGFIAGRWSHAPLAAVDCQGPVADEWFTGLGAGPVHDSVVQLTNPTDGEAVVDLLVYDAKGPVAVPRLRGIAVPAQGTKSFDLLTTMPRSGALAVHAEVERGQAVVSVVDRALKLTGSKGSDEWLSGQRHPMRDDVLLGVGPGGGSTTLYVANPSTSQLSATVKLVTPDSVLTPDDAPTLDLAPQSIAKVSLDALLASKVAAGTIGIEVVGTGAVTAAVRRTSSADLLVAAAGDRVGQPTAVLVPKGAKRLLLLGDTGVGAVTVTSTDTTGRQLGSSRVAITADQGASLTLPADAVLVSVVPDDVSVVGSVLVTAKKSATVVGLRERVRRNLVPAVRPGLR